MRTSADDRLVWQVGRKCLSNWGELVPRAEYLFEPGWMLDFGPGYCSAMPVRLLRLTMNLAAIDICGASS